jgi:hypothetical protein
MRVEEDEALKLGGKAQDRRVRAFDTAPLLAPTVVERDDDADGWFPRFAALDSRSKTTSTR